MLNIYVQNVRRVFVPLGFWTCIAPLNMISQDLHVHNVSRWIIKGYWQLLECGKGVKAKHCWVLSRILKREDKRQMTSLHRHFHCFLKILIFIAGGNDSFVVKNKFRAFWCLICLCSWIRSYLPPKKYWQEAMAGVWRHLPLILAL